MQASENLSDMVGFTPYKIEHLPISINSTEHSLLIEWDDGHQSEYHYLWLRDNCNCEACVTPLTREQMFEICDVPLEIKATSTSICEDGKVIVTWDHQNHVSHFHPGWLRSHCYSKSSRSKRQLTSKIWDKAVISQQLPMHQYQDVLNSDLALLNWLKDLRDYGISIVEDVDVTQGSLINVAERISFIRETNFGTLFDVVAKPNANSAAYTTLRLPLHTDLPTRELQPGLQFLHCLINDASGGESILVDGFKIAEHMREHFADDFAALTSLSISFYNKDKDTDYRFDGPLIATDGNGKVIEVRVANFLRGPLDLPADKVIPLYQGYRRFMLLTRDSQFQFYHRLNAGDLLVFDNRRVLHSRNAFDLKQGKRHLQGCYVDRDELLSRIRVLERNL